MAGKLKSLGITCTSSDCDNNLHCFKHTKEMLANNTNGKCRSCGIELIDWNRVHGRSISDVEYTFQALKTEMIRHHFWHVEIDEEALNHARRKGTIKIIEDTENRIRKSVGVENPFRDGLQTPFVGRVYYYAQHATASCCRACVQEWHGIAPGRALTEEEIQYLAQLATLYIQERLPNLTVEGEYIPRRPSLKQLQKAASRIERSHGKA